MAVKNNEKGFNDFVNDLREERLGNVVLFFGMERFLINWAANMIKKKHIDPATEAMDYAVFDPPAEISDILASCETFSLFSGRRMVWARDLIPLRTPGAKGYGESALEPLLEYVEEPNDGVILLMSNESVDGRSKLVRSLKKNADVYQFGTLDRRELNSFITRRFAQGGVSVTSRQISELIEASGYYNQESVYRLENFATDIDKLIAYSDSGVLGEDAIRELIAGDADSFIFDMIDSITGDDKKRALNILHNRLTEDPYGMMQIVGAIASQLEIMLSVKEIMEDGSMGRNADSIGKALGVHSFRVKKTFRYIDRYGIDKIRELLHDIYNIQYDMTRGVLDAKLALELFIAKI